MGTPQSFEGVLVSFGQRSRKLAFAVPRSSSCCLPPLRHVFVPQGSIGGGGAGAAPPAAGSTPLAAAAASAAAAAAAGDEEPGRSFSMSRRLSLNLDAGAAPDAAGGAGAGVAEEDERWVEFLTPLGIKLVAAREALHITMFETLHPPPPRAVPVESWLQLGRMYASDFFCWFWPGSVESTIGSRGPLRGS